MGTLFKVSQQTAWQLLGKVITALATFIILGAVSRNYGPGGTGVFTLALTYLAFFYLVADFGLNAYLLPKLLQSEANLYWRKLLGVRLVWVAFLIPVAVLIPPFLPFTEQRLTFSLAVLLGAAAILGNAVFLTANALFQAKLRYDFSLVTTAVGALGTVVLFLLLIRLDYPIPALLGVHALGWLVAGLISLVLVKRFFHQISPAFSQKFLKVTLMEAWPISLTLVLNLIYFRVDVLILASVKSFSEVGIYNVAYQVFQSALVLPTFIMNSYYPLMVKKLNESRGEFMAEVKKMGLILTALATLGVGATWILSPMVVKLIAGEGFGGSITSLQILSLGLPAYFISSLLMWVLVTLKKYYALVGIYLTGTIANIILNLTFIPQYSYIASSWVTGISEYLILLLQLIILIPVFLKKG